MQFFVSTQAIEADCDVVLDKVAGILTVTAFKCKTEGNFFYYFATYEHKHCHVTVSQSAHLSLSLFEIL